MYTFSIDGVVFRLQNDHTQLTVMVPEEMSFPCNAYTVRRMTIQDAGHGFNDIIETFVDYIDVLVSIPDNMLEETEDRMKNVKHCTVFYHARRYEVDVTKITVSQDKRLQIEVDPMSNYRVQ